MNFHQGKPPEQYNDNLIVLSIDSNGKFAWVKTRESDPSLYRDYNWTF